MASKIDLYSVEEFIEVIAGLRSRGIEFDAEEREDGCGLPMFVVTLKEED